MTRQKYDMENLEMETNGTSRLGIRCLQETKMLSTQMHSSLMYLCLFIMFARLHIVPAKSQIPVHSSQV